jgi:hypothetical protein
MKQVLSNITIYGIRDSKVLDVRWVTTTVYDILKRNATWERRLWLPQQLTLNNVYFRFVPQIRHNHSVASSCSWKKNYNKKHIRLLTTCRMVVLEKLTVTYAAKKFATLYGTRTFITVFTTVCHWSLCSASSVQSKSANPVCLSLASSTHTTSSHINSLTCILILQVRLSEMYLCLSSRACVLHILAFTLYNTSWTEHMLTNPKDLRKIQNPLLKYCFIHNVSFHQS